MRMMALWVALMVLMAGWLPGQSVPASRPSQEGWEAELEALVGRIAGVQAISGEFVQTRYTPMLRKPMVSSGRIRMAGGVMRWDTEKPSKSVLLIDQEGAKVYLPEQSLLEIYSIDAQTLRMASSPVPDLAAAAGAV